MLAGSAAISRSMPASAIRALTRAMRARNSVRSKTLIGSEIVGQGVAKTSDRVGVRRRIRQPADIGLVPAFLLLDPTFRHRVDGDVGGADGAPLLHLLAQFGIAAVDDRHRRLDADLVGIATVGDGDLAHRLDAAPAGIVGLEVGKPSVTKRPY